VIRDDASRYISQPFAYILYGQQACMATSCDFGLLNLYDIYVSNHKSP